MMESMCMEYGFGFWQHCHIEEVEPVRHPDGFLVKAYRTVEKGPFPGKDCPECREGLLR